MLIQSIFYPFEMISKRGRGVSLQTIVNGPTVTGRTNGEVSEIDTSAILDGGRLHIVAVNRSLVEHADIEVVVADKAIAAFHSGEALTGPDPKAANSYEEPELIVSRPMDEVLVCDGKACLHLPPMAVAAMTLELQR